MIQYSIHSKIQDSNNHLEQRISKYPLFNSIRNSGEARKKEKVQDARIPAYFKWRPFPESFVQNSN